MLKELIIQNVILVRKASVTFAEGFNVLSGETGSGKSTLLHALKLALGAKSDPRLVRQGAEKASVEAIFELPPTSNLPAWLEEKGIELEDSTLVLKRELSALGKSSAFINCQRVPLSVLNECGAKMVELVNQHDTHRLFHLPSHRDILDLFGQLEEKKKRLSLAWNECRKWQEKLASLAELSLKAEEETARYLLEVEEIESARLVPGEEEALFEEYQRLVSADERAQLVHAIDHMWEGEEGLLTLLPKVKNCMQALVKLDPALSQEQAFLHQIALEGQEWLRTLQNYGQRIENNPEKKERCNSRLTLIHKIKKKYGPELADINDCLASRKSKLKELAALDEEKSLLTNRLEVLEKTLSTLAQELSESRKHAASKLEKAMNKELASLNMPDAKLHVKFDSISLTAAGIDRVEFFLTPDKGGAHLAFTGEVSGGELARVLLALHLVLAHQEGQLLLVFDEIDANIGGMTASLIGEKLALLSRSCQILCVTHFPQVARFASHHFQLKKTVEKGTPISEIRPLNLSEKEEELLRMAGVLP